MIDRQEFRRVFGLANPGMVRTLGDHADRAIDEIASGVDDFIAEYSKRFGEAPDPIGLFNRNPERGRAFLQSDTLGLSLDLKIMVWRILLGAEIREIGLQYRLAGDSSLRVVLQTPYGEPDPPYEGRPVTDFRVLRHFGAVAEGGRLVLQGYYALK